MSIDQCWECAQIILDQQLQVLTAVLPGGEAEEADSQHAGDTCALQKFRPCLLHIPIKLCGSCRARSQHWSGAAGPSLQQLMVRHLSTHTPPFCLRV